ncbi:MAG: tetratricopeptide repeat protein [Bacteroidales bacterium]
MKRDTDIGLMGKTFCFPLVAMAIVIGGFVLLFGCRGNGGDKAGKNTGEFIPQEADSIAALIKKVTTPLEKAVYHFKMGEVYNSAEDSYRAMEEFLEAERLSMDIKNDLLKGRIYWYKGKIYKARLDYTNALNMFTLAKEYYTKGGRKEELMYTYEQMATIYSGTKNFEEAIVYYNKAKAIAMSLKEREIRTDDSWQSKGINNTNLQSNSGNDQKKYNKLILNFSTAISGVYFSQLNSSGEALEQLQQAYATYNNGKENEEDYFLLACIYLDAGKIEKANEYVARYREWKKNLLGTELAGLLSLQSSIAKGAGNFKEALVYKERYDIVMDSLNFIENNNSIREMEQQYWQKQLLLENEGMKHRNKYVIIIYTLMLSIVGAFFYIFISAHSRRLKQKDVQIEEYISVIDNLGNKIHSEEDSKNNLLNQLDVHKEKEKQLKDLLENRFLEVRELVRTYYEFGNSKKLQKKVDDLLKLQLSGDNFEVIEEVVNAKNNNAIKKVRESYPNLKEDNIKLLNLIYAGFSAQEISVILNDTPQNIYVRKSRLKKCLSSLIALDSEMNFN